MRSPFINGLGVRGTLNTRRFKGVVRGLTAAACGSQHYGVCNVSKVRDRMKQKIFTVCPSQTIEEAAQIMVEHNVGCTLVLGESDSLVGIVTERDVMRAVVCGIPLCKSRVEVAMTRNPISIRPDAEDADAVDLMKQGGFRHLPVAEGGRVVGILSMRDFFEKIEYGVPSPRTGQAVET